MSWVYFNKLKSQAFEYFKKFKVVVEKQSNCILKTLRIDWGEEFTSREYIFCEDYGIKREFTAPYTSQQNGMAERKNWMMVEMARNLLKR